METKTPSQPEFWDVAVAGLFLIAMVSFQVLICDSTALFHRGYWLDEYFTFLLASDSHPSHMVTALRHGLDGMPPYYYALAHAAQMLIGGDPIAAYRICSLGFICLGLIALYAALRYVMSPVPALAAVLAFWAHPRLMALVFEGRPYMLWLAGVALCAWAIRIRGRPGMIFLFLASAFTCAMHYFGIVTVYLLFCGELFAGPGNLRRRLWRIAPGVIGSFSIAPFVPLLIEQTRVFKPGWEEPLSLSVAGNLIQQVFYSLPLVLIAVCWAVGRLQGRKMIERQSLARLAGLLSFCFLPAIFFAGSMLGSAFTIDRYYTATTLGIAAIFGIMLAESHRQITLTLAGIFFVISTLNMRSKAVDMQQDTQRYDQIAAAAESPGADYTLLFLSRRFSYEMWFLHPELRGRIVIMDLGGIPLPAEAAFEQRMQRNTQNDYDLPPLRNVQAMAGVKFKFVGNEAAFDAVRRYVPLTLVDPAQGLYEWR